MSIDQDLIKDDLYLAVNGEWLETAKIPDDQPSTGGFMDVHKAVEDLLMNDVEAMAQGEISLENNIMEEFIAYYKLASDIRHRNDLGTQPAETLIEKLQAINNLQDLVELAVTWAKLDLPLPLKFAIEPDMKNTDLYALYMDVPALILPDTSMYSDENPAKEALLNIYRQMSIALLQAFKFSEEEAEKFVEDTIQLDARMVPYQRSSEDLADYIKIYNPRAMAEVRGYSKEFDFNLLINNLIGKSVDRVIVTQPEFFEEFHNLFNSSNFKQVKSWLLVKLVNALSAYLSEDIRQIASKFALAITGNPSTQSPNKHAYYLAVNQFDQALGDYYGKKYFGPEARADIFAMVKTMIEVYQERLQANQWLSPATIEQAINKLDKIEILVGYPDEIHEMFELLKVDSQATFFENTMELQKTRNSYEFKRWNQPVDRKQWGMSAAMVNAYYNPSSNLICFPAAILQAPFYSLEQSRSENYGGIGAVIAHEISHAFDNNGAQFDERGNIANWWTAEDLQAFEEKAHLMIEQWEGLETEFGPVNGKLTVSENIADAGGLIAAVKAAEREDDVDLRSLFINWARIWAMKARPEYAKLLLTMDVHAPNKLRANIPVQNYNEFYDVFDIQPGDGMFMKEDKRIEIW